MNLQEAMIYWIRLPEHTDFSSQGYIGVTKNLKVRLNAHLNQITKKTHKNPHLVNAVLKYGWDTLIKEIIFCGEEAHCYEIEESIRPSKAIGWNVSCGGHKGPGWIKGRKQSETTKEKLRLINEERKRKTQNKKNEERRKRIEARNKKREEKELEKKIRREERERARLERIQQKRKKEEAREQKRIAETNPVKMRPVCRTCNKTPCEINYNRNGIVHYRTICTECKRNKQKKPPYKPLWLKSGYKKKQICDQCGFKCIYPSQMTVYHIDGNLNNVNIANLRTICLNCVEIVKRVNVNWKRGDLTVDYK